VELTVIGAGYVGVVTGCNLAALGHDVVLLESDPGRLEALRAGSVPFFEPGLSELLSDAIATGSIRATGAESEALANRDAILVCVGTPLGPGGQADLSQVRAACAAIKRNASGGVVVMRSTLPIGTSDDLAGWLGRDTFDDVVTNPEFLRQGTAVGDFRNPTRIVVGTRTGEETSGSRRVREMYQGIEAPFIVTDFASAEMIKNASNGYLAMKLSFINEIADLCEAYGADVEAVVAGMGFDPRIGPSYLRPGIGFGGSCLPKELANLLALGRRRNLPMHMFDAASRSNDERAKRVANRLESIRGDLSGSQVGVLGLSFKAQTDDTRYSPAVALAREMLARGASVSAHDPQVPSAVSDRISGLTRVDGPESAVAGSDLVVIATDWPMYRGLDWAAIAETTRAPVLFDGRNALDRLALERAGWRVIRIGATDRAA
jgi:UDPglucose 6-dehydrogenase